MVRLIREEADSSHPILSRLVVPVPFANPDFGMTLGTALKGRGLQLRLAEFINVSPATVTKWVHGNSVPHDSTTFEKIAAFFVAMDDANPSYQSVAFWTLQASPEVVKVLQKDPTAWLWFHPASSTDSTESDSEGTTENVAESAALTAVTESNQNTNFGTDYAREGLPDLFSTRIMARAQENDPMVYKMLQRLKKVVMTEEYAEETTNNFKQTEGTAATVPPDTASLLSKH